MPDPPASPRNTSSSRYEDFKDGARSSWDKRKRNTGQMIGIAQGLSPEEAQIAADYFSSMKWTPWVKVVETDTVPKTRFVGAGGGLDMPLTGAEAGMEPLGDRIVETPISPGGHRTVAQSAVWVHCLCAAREPQER